MNNHTTLVLGAGITGLAAGITSQLPVLEARDQPGGICGSYYIKPGDTQIHSSQPDDRNAYRFEYGGGHWIFGGDSAIVHFMNARVPLKSYGRLSSVYFSRDEKYVPYPIQNHLGYLGPDLAAKVLRELTNAPQGRPTTMADWLEQNFGKTLLELFFAPFHELYTAGLWTRIAPQDAYKSPVDLSLVIQGAFEKTPAVGYNTTFVYPIDGLNTLAQRMADHCQIQYNKAVAQIDLKRQEVLFTDGSGAPYEALLSTLPLNQVMNMTGLAVDAEPDPYSSVLVLNIGATRGAKCPDDHWLYNPDARSGFHRVGFYSNVDRSFLPQTSQESGDRVSIYVERAYPGGQRPSAADTESYAQAVVQELTEWGFIERAEVVDPTWIDVAYTWAYPGSGWRKQALQRLLEYNIHQVGRYARWSFQGIADSIRDGFFAGASLRNY